MGVGRDACRVTAVSGTVVAIDRKQKHVVLDSGLIVPYDTLVLTPGLQVRCVYW